MAVAKSIDRLIFLVLCITSFLLLPGFPDEYYFAKAVFLVICVLLIFTKWLLYEPNKLWQIKTLSTTATLCLVYFFWICCATLFSIDKLNSVFGYLNRWDGLIILSCYAALLLFSSIYFNLTESKMQVLVLCGCVMSLIGFAQFLKIYVDEDYFFPLTDRFVLTSATLGTSNYLGAYLTVFLTITVFLYLMLGNLYYLPASALIYGALLTSMTRGAWLGSIVALLILFIYFLHTGKRVKRVVHLSLLFFVVTISLDFMMGGLIVLRFFSVIAEFFKLTVSKFPDPNAGSGRMLLWISTLKAIPNYPIFGVGLSNLQYIFMRHYPELIVDGMLITGSAYHRAHNEFIHIAATTGIPGLLVYIALLVSAFKAVGRNLLNEPKNLMVLAILGAYVVQSLFCSSVVSFSFILWIFLGVAAGVGNQGLRDLRAGQKCT